MEIRRRPRHRNQGVSGTKTDNTAILKAGPRKAWLYVGKLNSSTTEEDVKEYLHKQGIHNVECELLKTVGHLKAFQVGIPLAEHDRVHQADFWPEGVYVRQYIFRRPRNNGFRL
ncbi:hypothetical protein C0J52_11115 [Blattella germanica]|nr:hypothetical protein C0J52_11115 [Blattella germanica]